MAMKVGVLSMIEDAESKELNHLGLVAGMFDELEIGETIDSLIKQDLGQRKVSIGIGVYTSLLWLIYSRSGHFHTEKTHKHLSTC